MICLQLRLKRQQGVGPMFKNKRYKIFHRLQYKIFIFTLLIVLIPLVSLGVFSYLKSSERVQQKVVESDLNTVTQIGNNIELMKNDVEDTSLFLIQNKTIRDFLKMSPSAPKEKLYQQRENVKVLLNQLFTEKKYIDSVYLKGFNGYAVNTKQSQQPLDQRTIKRLKTLNGKGIWQPGNVVDFSGSSNNVLAYSRLIRDFNNVSDNLGILKMNLDMDALHQLYRNNQQMRQGSFQLVNQHNTVISASDQSLVGSRLSKQITAHSSFKTSTQGHYTAALNGEKHAVVFDQIGSDGWKVAYQVPLKKISNQQAFIPATLVIIVVFAFVVCALFAFLFSRHVVAPIKRLSSLMNQVEHDNYNSKFDVKGNDEITRLGQSFNNMSQRLKQLINDIYAIRIKKKEAELKALQAQINPHFLYNTLDTIYWMARIEKAFETSKLVEAMSKLFRLSLNSGREITTVKDELAHLRHYMVIQQKRYEDMMDFELRTDDDVSHAQTVKMVLQPLVENAIVHGLEEKDDGNGSIVVAVYHEDDHLFFRISDDGPGVDPGEMEQLLAEPQQQQNRGFGVKNVNDRIQLYFGDQYGLTFYQDGEGTTVLVKQPWKAGAHDDEVNDY